LRTAVVDPPWVALMVHNIIPTHTL